MAKIAYSGEDLVLAVRANTGATTTYDHKKPDKTVTTAVAMTEDGTTGDFYATFNSSDVGLHILTLNSTDTDVDGMILTVEVRATSNEDLDTLIDTVDSVVDGIATDVGTVSSAVSDVDSDVAAVKTVVDAIKSTVDATHHNNGWL